MKMEMWKPLVRGRFSRIHRGCQEPPQDHLYSINATRTMKYHNMSCKAMQFDNMTGSLSLLGLLVSLVSELQGFLGYYSTYPEMYETNDTQTQTQHYQLNRRPSLLMQWISYRHILTLLCETALSMLATSCHLMFYCMKGGLSTFTFLIEFD